MKYLKNSAKPIKITIVEEPFTSYLSKDGNRCDVIVIMHRKDGEQVLLEKENIGNEFIQNELKKLGDDDKMIMNLVNGEFTGKKTIVALDHTIQITHYPHILNFAVGTSRYNRRVYNLMVGETIGIENERDADVLMKQYGFIDEVDAKGVVIKEGVIHNPENIRRIEVDWNKVPKVFEEIPYTKAPRQSSLDKRVDKFVYNNDLSDK
jgi:hypothetical protein